jgi:hypothetical protein
VAQVLSDYTTAPIGERLRATLALLEKMTLDPGGLQAGDVRTAMSAGASKQAIQDAMEVAFLFNIYDRLADSMGWDVPALAGGYYTVAARRLIKHGYGGRQAGTAHDAPTV